MPIAGIDRIKFNPQARPVDTVGVDTSFQSMAAPVREANPLKPGIDRLPASPVDESGATQQLVQSLQSFGGAVGSIFNMRDEQQKKDDTLQAGFDAMRSSAKTWAEAVQQNPELASKSPFYRDTFQSSIAQTSMSKRIGEIQAAYYTSPLVNSTDPGAIQQWFTDQIKGDLDRYTDPAERQAALEVASNAAKAFSEAHAKNATGNLLRQADAAAGARMTEDLDAHSASPVAQPVDITEFAAKDLSPEEKALLAGIAAGESGGKYDIRYGGVGSAGKTFALDGAHPNVPESTKDGRTSTAAGRYQFLKSTWDDIWRSNGQQPPAFTPENQDKAAILLAKRDFKQRTGEDLMETLKTEGFSNRVMNNLQGTWESFKVGNRARFAATYNGVLKSVGLQPSDAITADPNMDALQEKLYSGATKDEASGMTRKQSDGNIMTAVINKAVETGDVNYLKILEVKREGRPTIADDPEHRKVIQSTIEHIHTLQTTKDNAARTAQDRVHKDLVERFKREIYITQEERMIKGEDPSYPHEMIIKAAGIDSDLAEKMRTLNEQVAKGKRDDDPKDILDLQVRLYNGDMTPDDVRDAVSAGKLKDPSNISKFMEQARQNVSQSFLNSTPFRDAMTDINDVLGDPMNLDMERARSKVEAKGEVREAFAQFMREHPKALPAEQASFLHNTTKAILGTRADIDAWKLKDKPTEAPSTSPAPTTPAPAGKASTTTAEAPVVTPAFNWRTSKAFPSVERLDAAWAEFMAETTKPSPFRQTLVALNLTTPEQWARFYRTQRALLGAK